MLLASDTTLRTPEKYCTADSKGYKDVPMDKRDYLSQLREGAETVYAFSQRT
jgi:hypothetical protein